MDVTFIVAVSILLLFISLILVTAINYFTRIPESITIIELRNKVKHFLDVFFGSGGIVTGERVTTDLYRIPLLLEERNGTARTNEVIGVGIEYDDVCNKKTSWNNTIRVYDQQFNELPSKISYQEFCSSQWLNNSIVTFVVDMSANEKKRVYVYSINNTNTTAPSHNITNITNLVAYWNFDEISGTLVKDVSSNENNGTQIGGINCSVSGLFRNACRSDGVDDYINVTDDPILRPASQVSWSVWVKRDGAGTGTNPHIIRFGDNGEPFFVERGTDNVMWIRIKTSDNGEVDLVDSLAIPSTFTHYAVVYNSSGIGLYRNGTLVNSTSATGSLSYDNNTLTIGGDGNDEFFNGTIDDLRIYSKALSSSEISNLASTIPTVTVFPAQTVIAISSAKVQELTGRNYQEIKAVLGGDFDFRIEISEK